MHIAVTGATGFLGRHVIPSLLAKGAQVTALVRPTSLRGPWLDDCAIVEGDITGATGDAFARLGRPDCVVHLAWQGLPNYNSFHHFEVELPHQYSFLKQLLQAGLGRLVVAGTCFEYGMQSGALAETLSTSPSNPYGFAKDALRRQLQFLRRSVGFSLVWARLFYTYGAGQPDASLFGQFQLAAAAGRNQFDMSPGDQLRDYLPVEHVGRLLAELAVGQGDPGVVNVCAGRPTSVRSLVEGWIRERGLQMKMNLGHFPYSELEPMAFWGDARKLADVLSAAAGERPQSDAGR